MRFDPTRRLARPLPGADLPGEERALNYLFDREKTEGRPEVVPPRDQGPLRMTVRRSTTKVATCQPNAPLLIRIVRFPFALHPAPGSRLKYLEQWEKFSRVDWSAEVAAALADRVRLRFTSADRARPSPFAVRPSTWTLLPSDPGAAR